MNLTGSKHFKKITIKLSNNLNIFFYIWRGGGGYQIVKYDDDNNISIQNIMNENNVFFILKNIPRQIF